MDTPTAPAPPRRRRWPRVLGGLFLLLLVAGGLVMINIWSAFGGRPGGERLARMQQSPQWVEGRFANRLPMQMPDMLPVLKRWIFDRNSYQNPSEPLPVVQRTAADFSDLPDDVRITWLGHSSMLVEMDGQRLLIDPVFGDYASPSPLFGVKRFYAPPLPLDALPPIDAVMISHDHYDHLNEPTIQALANRVDRFLVPLGVGAHLEAWGVAPERIEAFDWWDETMVGDVRVVAAPARHFSGRSLVDRDRTLWASWALLGTERRVYFSGDTGMFPGFTEIGNRLGPFDVAMMENGAYNASWPDAHMGPEQAVAAHQMVRGGLFIPIHWGTFNLAFHSWTEPVERLLVAAEAEGIPVAIPRPGESLTLANPPPVERWWPDLPWQTAEEAPVISTGLDPVVE